MYIYIYIYTHIFKNVILRRFWKRVYKYKQQQQKQYNSKEWPWSIYIFK